MAAGSQPSAVSYRGKAMQNRENQKKPEKKRTSDRTDRRVVRTKRSIRMALTKLLASKPLGEITVTELCKAADINRKTFYNYYSDVSMVVDEIEDEIAQEFASSINKIDFLEISNEPEDIFLRASITSMLTIICMVIQPFQAQPRLALRPWELPPGGSWAGTFLPS